MVLDSTSLCLYSRFLRFCGMPSPIVEQADNNSTFASRSIESERRNAIVLIAAFAAVYVIWGSTYLAIAIGIESFPPLLLAATRHFAAGLVLYPVLRWKTGIRPTPA